MSTLVSIFIGTAAGIILIFTAVFIVGWFINRGNRKDFTLEYEAKTIDKDNNASTGSLISILGKCPRDATVVFAVNSDGNMRIRLDNIVDYNAALNEVVLFPFDVPTEEGGYTDMVRRRMKKDALKVDRDDEDEDDSTGKR